MCITIQKIPFDSFKIRFEIRVSASALVRASEEGVGFLRDTTLPSVRQVFVELLSRTSLRRIINLRLPGAMSYSTEERGNPNTLSYRVFYSKFHVSLLLQLLLVWMIMFEFTETGPRVA